MPSRRPAGEFSRREFLGSSAKNAAGVAAGMVGLSTAVALGAPVERIAVGLIGARTQGRRLATALAALPDVDLPVVCDVDPGVASDLCREVAEGGRPAPRTAHDFRRLLDDPTLDAVVIAVPDHWHAAMALLALQAGKDVFVETPLAHDVVSGERIVAAARRTGRVVRTGMPQRAAEHFRSAVEQVRSGRLGKVRLARAWTTNSRKPLGTHRTVAAPAGVDYELWLGPAPRRPFQPNRFHHNWRWFWDYGSGELGQWGVPMLDVARWGLGLDLPRRVSAAGGRFYFDDEGETPDTLSVQFDYGRATIVWEHRQWSPHMIEGRSTGAAFYGDAGTLVVDRGGWKIYGGRESAGVEPTDKGDLHVANFVAAVRTRDASLEDLIDAHVSTALCHYGNVAYRLGREIDLAAGLPGLLRDRDAAELLAGEARAPWRLPEV